MNRIKATTGVAATAALFVGLAAPVASAHSWNAPERGVAKHHSSIPFTSATVTAGTHGSYTLKWNAPGTRSVLIRADGRVVAHGGSQGQAVVKGLPAVDRQWFTFDAGRGDSLQLADRLIKLDGTVNFRDVGGYRTADGHWVKMGQVYRSDALDKLTAADQAKLRRLGIRTDYDLRAQSEREQAPDRVPAGVRYVVADVLGAAGNTTVGQMPTTAEGAEQMMVDGEKGFVDADSAKAAFSKVMAGAGDSRARGVLYHCTAGKDRTGWATAALLTALGVPRETVTDDYLASNTYRAAGNAAALAAMPADQAAVYKPLLDVRREYLNSGFDEIKAKYGSFSAYFDKGLGVNQKELGELKHDLLVG
ncbi:tyrosine-protein phosphatase [Streptomyces sp. SID11385]|uniref:tyrosine-protein phosphatase n=1 Tax=Streptomyces sp. SID11385 TaxID=2706031 RepID=UPI0013CA0EB2|nr:tyrosine-protein phosphatase [Streptomyces sp. SID11385]NEA43614.1 tyrosine-protein phosphatase [Streptomyces sp. SID11385]